MAHSRRRTPSGPTAVLFAYFAGGSWDDIASQSRSAARYFYNASYWDDALGFRVARSATISNLSRGDYEIDQLVSGKLPYVDRTYTFLSPVPEPLSNRIYIRTRQEDKDTTSIVLSFDVNQNVLVTIGIDERIAILPSWLQSWKRQSDQLLTNDPGLPGRKLYTKKFDEGHITLGANRDSSMPKGRSMYTVVITPLATGARGWMIYSEIEPRTNSRVASTRN